MAKEMGTFGTLYMISIIIGFTENAMKTAAKYTTHSGRKVV